MSSDDCDALCARLLAAYSKATENDNHHAAHAYATALDHVHTARIVAFNRKIARAKRRANLIGKRDAEGGKRKTQDA